MANDLVDSSGACPPQAAQQPAPDAPSKSGRQCIAAGAAADQGSLLGGGVALGMTECDVRAACRPAQFSSSWQYAERRTDRGADI